MGLASQGYRRQHLATIGFDKAFEISQRAAHTHKIIYQNIFCPRAYGASKSGLSRQSGKTIGSSVKYDVSLIDVVIYGPIQHFVKQISKNFWNSVNSPTLKRVCTDQRGLMACQQCSQMLVLCTVHCRANQNDSGIAAPSFRRFIRRMLFHRRLTGVNQHIGEITPRCARRFDRF